MSYNNIISKYFDKFSKKEEIANNSHVAVLLEMPQNSKMVAVLNSAVEGVHFLANSNPADVGYKSVVASYSKLMASGAKPAWVQCDISMPEVEESWLESLADGILLAMQKYGGSLVGVNIEKGQRSITMSVNGVVGNSLVTALAKQPHAGDLIYVTGTLGDAGLAVKRILQDIPNDDVTSKHLLDRLIRPLIPLSFAAQVRPYTSASIAVVGGLNNDLNKLIQRYNVGADIFLNKLPLSEQIKAIIEINSAYQFALSGVDDYELLFTVAPADVAQVSALAMESGHNIKCIGEISSSSNVNVYDADGKEFIIKKPESDHFAVLDGAEDEY